jgi:hypothetical protein
MNEFYHSDQLFFLRIREEKAISNVVSAFWTIHGFIGMEYSITVLTEPERDVNIV